MDSLLQLDLMVRDKTFGAKGSALAVLNNVGLAAAAGDRIAIIGPSGCGKTSLLKIIAGLDNDFAGSIDWKKGERATTPTFGFAFQSPQLLPWYSVEENVGIVLPTLSYQDVTRAIDTVDAGAFRRRRPYGLSGGMTKRVNLAQAIVGSPDVLLLDEAFAGLDPASRSALYLRVREQTFARRQLVFLVTHDIQDVFALATRIIVLGGGAASSSVLADLRPTNPVSFDEVQDWAPQYAEINRLLVNAS